jgi:hypothetical protein
MSNEEVPVIHIADEDIVQSPKDIPVKKKPGPKPKPKMETAPPPVPAPVSKVGYERPPKPDPVVTNRREFTEVVEDGRRHQEALDKSIKVTTAARDYVSIIFTPAQVSFMKALLLPQKAPIADEILVKFDSAF